ncbi:MAG: polysaccharide biosynthesis protein [Firmicutes bacterium]|nr:polysaccharide biosynthesis protein [Bacillota bacterium]
MGGSVWSGALWLSLGSLVSRLLGAVYRIFLPRILGDYGVGLFQMAYPLYAVLLALSINGVPVALAKATAAQRAAGRAAEADRLAAWTFRILLGVGSLLAAVVGLGAPWLARVVFREPAAAWSIRALAPALAFVAGEAALRGAFLGQRRTGPAAASQVLEQLVRVAVMFPLALALLPRGVHWAAAGATAGAPAGALAGTLLLLILNRRRGPRPRGPWPRAALLRLAADAAPMSLSGLLFPLLMLADSVVVPARLAAAGLGLRQATAAYGRLSGEAMPLVNLTLIAGAALAASLVPEVAQAVARGEGGRAEERVQQVVTLVWAAALPMSGGLMVLAPALTRLLYGGAGAAPALRVLAAGVGFLSLQQVLAAALQAAGRGWAPVANLVWGALLKLALSWALTPWLGIRGAAAGTVAAAVVAALLNWRAWRRQCQRPSDWTTLLAPAAWPLAATVVMGTAVRLWMAAAPAAGPTAGLWALGAVAVGAAVYGLTLVAVGQAGVLARIWAGR